MGIFFLVSTGGRKFAVRENFSFAFALVLPTACRQSVNIPLVAVVPSALACSKTPVFSAGGYYYPVCSADGMVSPFTGFVFG